MQLSCLAVAVVKVRPPALQFRPARLGRSPVAVIVSAAAAGTESFEGTGMANETAEEQQQPKEDQVVSKKGYSKRGLVSEKVLLQKLSDMSIEENVENPTITLSSVEDENDFAMEDEDAEETQRKDFPCRAPLKSSLSLDVPALSLEQEAKRPPL